MSFLNPVNEPVLVFRSTDVGAPQINHSSRTVGDVKAIFKACLVDGYGTKASAGWSIINEVGHVAEFVSPALSLSNYRFGINDSVAATITHYYTYDDVRVNPASNTAKRDFVYTDAVSAKNGWTFIVSDRGFYFVEAVKPTAVSETCARMTHWGAMKSALELEPDKNITFFTLGWGAATNSAFTLLEQSIAGNRHIVLDSYSSLSYVSANKHFFAITDRPPVIAAMPSIAKLYIATGINIIAEQVGLLLKSSNAIGVYEDTLNGRNVLNVTIALESYETVRVIDYARTFLIYLDQWEY